MVDVGGMLADYNKQAGNCPDWEPPANPATKTLLVGWRRDIQDMIFELDKWVEPGSRLTMLNHSIDEDEAREILAEEDCICAPHPSLGGDGSLYNLTVDFQMENPIFRRELARVGVEDYDSIMVLTETVPGAEGLSSDSRSMITMLLCRDLQKEAVQRRNAKTWGFQKRSTEATLIAEILDPRTADLIKLSRADDHMVSNAMISMCLAQMSEEPDMGLLIDDIFSEEGNELHIKDIRCYVHLEQNENLSFWGILNRARQRGEVAIGYQRLEDTTNGSPEKGLVINPLDKSAEIHWTMGDKIVVISED